MKAAINLLMAVRIGLIGVRTSPNQTNEASQLASWIPTKCDAMFKMPRHESEILKRH